MIFMDMQIYRSHEILLMMVGPCSKILVPCGSVLGALAGMIELTGFSVEGDVTANEFTIEPMSGMHHDEAAGGGIDNQIARLRDSRDQARDEADRLNVWMDFAIDFLRPAVRDAMIAPCAFRLDRRLLIDD
jgi:hypothetical protein